MFETDSATLSKRARSALFDLGGVLRHINNQIGVNGYADEGVREDKKYESDWEISLARAIAVGNAIKRAGYTDDVLSYGYGKSRSIYLKTLPVKQFETLSRRIDIVIMSTGGAI